MSMIEATLPIVPGPYAIDYVMVDHVANPAALREAVAEAIEGSAPGEPEQLENAISISIDAEIEADPSGIEKLLRSILDAGARTAYVAIKSTPDHLANVLAVMQRDALGNDGEMTVMRHPTHREEAGGEPLSDWEREIRTVRPAAPRPPAGPIMLQDADDAHLYATELKASLKSGLGIDLATSQARELVLHAIDEGRLDIDKLSAAMSADLNIPLRVSAAFVRGVRRERRAEVADIEWMFSQDPKTAKLAGKSGDLAANAGFQRLVADVWEALGNEGEPSERQAAEIFMFLHLAAEDQIAQSVAVKDQRSDEFQFAASLQRAIAKGDAHGVGDIYGQAPPRVAEKILDDIAHNARDLDILSEGPRFALDLADTLAEEPLFETNQRLNYGPRWRRLDTPDHLTMDDRLNIPLLRHGWVRTCYDTSDQDGRVFDPEHQYFLPGDDHDFSDVMWMIGVGPNPENVAPLLACMVGREMIKPGHIEWRHMPLPSQGGSMTDLAIEALAVALYSQMLDDIQWQIEEHGSVTLTMNTSDPVPKGEGESRKLVSYRFMNYVIQAVQGMNREHGRQVVTIIKDGEAVNDRLQSSMEQTPASGRFEAIEMRAAIGEGAWGAAAFIDRTGRVTFLRIDEPEDDDELKATIEERDETIEDGDYADFLEDAALEVEWRAQGEERDDLTIEAAMMRDGRVALVVADGDGGIGISLEQPAPGVDPAIALQALISRYRNGEEIQHDFGLREREYRHSGDDEEIDFLTDFGAMLGMDPETTMRSFEDVASLTLDESSLLQAGASLPMAKGLSNSGHPRWWKERQASAIEGNRRITVMHVDFDGGDPACRAALGRISREIGIAIKPAGDCSHGLTSRISADISANGMTMLRLVDAIVSVDGVEMAAIAWLEDDELVLAHRHKDGQAKLFTLIE